MIVLDASAALDFLLRDEAAFDWTERQLRDGGRIAAPHLLDTDVAHVLRKHVLAGRLHDGRAAEAIADLTSFPLDRYPASPLLPRIWELRHNLSGYDATYVALAEMLDAPLVTSDRRLLAVPAAVTSATIVSRSGTRRPGVR